MQQAVPELVPLPRAAGGAGGPRPGAGRAGAGAARAPPDRGAGAARAGRPRGGGPGGAGGARGRGGAGRGPRGPVRSLFVAAAPRWRRCWRRRSCWGRTGPVGPSCPARRTRGRTSGELLRPLGACTARRARAPPGWNGARALGRIGAALGPRGRRRRGRGAALGGRGVRDGSPAAAGTGQRAPAPQLCGISARPAPAKAISCFFGFYF